eukprot:jgi/Chlat1/3581/Chrsp234S03598
MNGGGSNQAAAAPASGLPQMARDPADTAAAVADAHHFSEGLRALHEGRTISTRSASLRRRSSSTASSFGEGGLELRPFSTLPTIASERAAALAVANVQLKQEGVINGNVSGGSAWQLEKPAELQSSLEVYGEEVDSDILANIVQRYYALLLELQRYREAQELASTLEQARHGAKDGKDYKEELTGIETLLKDGLMAFLSRIAAAIPPRPTQVVRFKGVTYTGSVAVAGSLGYETVGSRLGKCLLPCAAKARSTSVSYPILNDASGYLMPGTLTIVLGPPGCGKTSVHKALAGRLASMKSVKLTGEVKYNDQDIRGIVARRLAAYIQQTDAHIPVLTVRETCTFARDCTIAGASRKMEKDKNVTPELAALLGPVYEEGGDPRVDIVLKLMGLDVCADTIVGNQLLRGVSGGERHRVTTAEMMCGIYSVYCFDEISTGLDSSATYDITFMIKTIARLMRTTNIFSLLQPPPEVFDLFDRIIQLDHGEIVYQGPKDDVLAYYHDLGYTKPPHVDVADFLQEVTTSSGQEFLRRGAVPLDHDGFVAAYKASKHYQDVMRVVEGNGDGASVPNEVWVRGSEDPTRPLGCSFVDTPAGPALAHVHPDSPLADHDNQHNTDLARVGDIVRAVSGPADPTAAGIPPPLTYLTPDITAAKLERYVQAAAQPVRLQLERPFEEVSGYKKEQFEVEFVQAPWPSTKTLFRRQFAVAWRNIAFTLARLAQVLILGIVTGTLFWRISDDSQQGNMRLKTSVVFMGVLTLSVGAIAQIPTQIDERSVFYKHFNARFFRPSSFVLANAITGIPFSTMEVFVYGPIVYFMSGLSLSPRGAPFFIYMLILALAALFGSALVRLLTSVAPTRDAAASFAGLLIVFFTIFAGFLITKGTIPSWWIWMYWASPMQWTYTGLVLNEFMSPKYDTPCDQLSPLPNYCVGRGSMRFGSAFLELYQLPATKFRIWTAVIALLAYYAIFTCLTFVTMGKTSLDNSSAPSIANKEEKQQQLQQLASKETRSKTSQQATMSTGTQLATLQDAEEGVAVSAVPAKRVGKGSGLDFTPATLSFHDLSYEVQLPGGSEWKTLLHGISGLAKPGTMTALMGSSGAGKTTLLDVLFGRKTGGRISGEVLEQQSFGRISGYCEQNDIHAPFATVREALQFSADLRLDRKFTAAQRAAFVVEVMDLLDLAALADALIGESAENGLSVEQRKRLTIGVELVANPSILFLDEPTSGLDSRAAQRVMRGIQNIAATGRSVICTIHQPSHRLFRVFDNLLLLRRGGETNPASYMLEVIGAGIGHKSARDYALDYRKSALARRNEQDLEHARVPTVRVGEGLEKQKYVAPLTRQFQVVVLRALRTYWRNVSYSFGRIAFAIVLSLLLGTAFFQLNQTTFREVTSRSGLIFIASVFYAIVNANNIIPQLNYERAVFYRERSTRMYSEAVYNVSWSCAELPYLVVSTLVFVSICFSLGGVATGDARTFFLFWLLFFLFCSMTVSLGLMLAILTPNAMTAAVLVPVVVNVWNLTSGFLIPKANFPNFYLFIYWINPSQYTFNGLTSLAFRCERDGCDTDINSACYSDPSACPDCTCPRISDLGNVLTWPYVRQSQSLDYGRLGWDIGFICLMIVLFRSMAFIGLKFLRYDKR